MIGRTYTDGPRLMYEFMEERGLLFVTCGHFPFSVALFIFHFSFLIPLDLCLGRYTAGHIAASQHTGVQFIIFSTLSLSSPHQHHCRHQYGKQYKAKSRTIRKKREVEEREIDNTPDITHHTSSTAQHLIRLTWRWG